MLQWPGMFLCAHPTQDACGLTPLGVPGAGTTQNTAGHRGKGKGCTRITEAPTGRDKLDSLLRIIGRSQSCGHTWLWGGPKPREPSLWAALRVTTKTERFCPQPEICLRLSAPHWVTCGYLGTATRNGILMLTGVWKELEQGFSTVTRSPLKNSHHPPLVKSTERTSDCSFWGSRWANGLLRCFPIPPPLSPPF